MNVRIQKLRSEITKVKGRIDHLQERLVEMERQREELENTEIVEMVRSISATPEELADFIKAFRTDARKAMRDRMPQPAMIGYVYPKSAPESETGAGDASGDADTTDAMEDLDEQDTGTAT